MALFQAFIRVLLFILTTLVVIGIWPISVSDLMIGAMQISLVTSIIINVVESIIDVRITIHD